MAKHSLFNLNFPQKLERNHTHGASDLQQDLHRHVHISRLHSMKIFLAVKFIRMLERPRGFVNELTES